MKPYLHNDTTPNLPIIYPQPKENLPSQSKVKNSIYSSKDGAKAPESFTKGLNDLKIEIEKSTNKVGYLGKVFQELHKTAPIEERNKCYERLGKILKDNGNDYGLVLSAIFKTQDGLANIDGSHLNYVVGVLRKNGSHSDEEVKQPPAPNYKLVTAPKDFRSGK